MFLKTDEKIINAVTLGSAAGDRKSAWGQKYVKTIVAIPMICAVVIGLLLTGAEGVSNAGSTPAQAKAMVEKAIAYYKANGRDGSLAEISNSKGRFVKDDLYVFVYDMKGKCVAHGFNQKLVGIDLADMRDPDGTYYVKERIEIVKAKGKGWQDYKFSNPVTKKIEHKTAYVEKAGDLIFGCGAYK